MARFNVKVKEPEDSTELYILLDQNLKTKQVSHSYYFDKICSKIKTEENQLRIQLKNYEEVASRLSLLQEQRIILEKSKLFNIPSRGGDILHSFSNLAGLIEVKDQEKFRRMIFRATRGNAVIMFEQVDELVSDARTNEKVKKVMFLVLFTGGEDGALGSRVNRIADGFNARKMQLEDNQDLIDMQYSSVVQEIKETQSLTDITYEEIMRILRRFQKSSTGGYSRIEKLRRFIVKEKSIYHTMNMFLEKGGFYYASGWIPVSQELEVRAVFASKESGELHRQSAFPSDQDPPTYFRLNDFTTPF